jgi:hypothetical protein
MRIWLNCRLCEVRIGEFVHQLSKYEIMLFIAHAGLQQSLLVGKVTRKITGSEYPVIVMNWTQWIPALIQMLLVVAGMLIFHPNFLVDCLVCVCWSKLCMKLVMDIQLNVQWHHKLTVSNGNCIVLSTIFSGRMIRWYW